MRAYLIYFSAILLSPFAAYCEDVSQIINRANHAAYYQGQDGRARVHMVIKDSNGTTRQRDFVILRRDDLRSEDDTGDQKFAVFFSRPADVNKTVFLVHKHLDSDDDRWLYLPALDLVRRIAAGDKRTSFVGSTFYYEDVSGRNPSADEHELIEETDNYYVIKSTPRNPKEVEFSYYKNWIHKQTYIPVKTEYFDGAEKSYRIYEAVKVETVDGFSTVTESRMRDLKGGGETVMKYAAVKYNIDLPEEVFTERYMRNPPQQYMR